MDDDESQNLRKLGLGSDDDQVLWNDKVNLHWFYTIDTLASYEKDNRISIITAGGFDFYVKCDTYEIMEMVKESMNGNKSMS
jgi:hypothetical protein